MTTTQSLSLLKKDYPDGFWSFDAQQRRFSLFKLDNNPDKTANKQYVFRADDFMSIRLTWTSNNSLLGLAIDGESRLTEYDTTGAELARYGDYDNLFDNKYSKGTLAQLYQGVLRADSRNQKFVHSSIYVDRLELFDLVKKEFIEIVGPLNIDPVFKEAKIRGHAVLDIDVNETYHTYLDSFVNEDKVYAFFLVKNGMEHLLGQNTAMKFMFLIILAKSWKS